VRTSTSLSHSAHLCVRASRRTTVNSSSYSETLRFVSTDDSTLAMSCITNSCASITCRPPLVPHQPPAEIPPPTSQFISQPSIPSRSTQSLPAASRSLPVLRPQPPRRSMPSLAHTRPSLLQPQPATTRTPLMISETLWPIPLPTNVLADFYAFAAANTDANVETCGILCGRFDATTRHLAGPRTSSYRIRRRQQTRAARWMRNS
jgi:hypothetical protein